MKKYFFTFILCIIFTISIDAKEMKVKFSKCVDGDTAKFIYKEEEITARFLAVDTPETKHPTKGEEPYGKEASEYTCERLKNAENITLESDEDSDEKDKYERYLVWVFVDGELLQKELVRNGLASVAYLYGDYKYTNELEEVEQIAEDEKIGIWSITDSVTKEEKEIDYKQIIILTGIILMMCLFSTKTRKKVKSEAKKTLKKEIKNIIK